MAMFAGLTGFKRWAVFGGAGLLALLLVAAIVYRDDLLRTALDPKAPYQVYAPPPAPNYKLESAWALMPAKPRTNADLPADVFFVHPTTYDGGRDWNAPLDNEDAADYLTRVALPNYAGPFVRVGRIFAPRYRQASLYTRLTLREDARDARRFAYGDVLAAFREWRASHDAGRPFIVVGVEQGGELAARLLRDEIAPDPQLMARLAAAYLIDTVVAEPPIPVCTARRQARCLVAYAVALEGDAERERYILGRSLVWDARGQLEDIAGRAPVCVNPLLGAQTGQAASPKDHLGATNATGLEWGARPAFLKRHVEAQCVDGILRVSRPKSDAFKPAGSWADRRKAPGYNLFYADLEEDAQARVATLMGRPDFPKAAPPITKRIVVRSSPVRRIN